MNGGDNYPRTLLDSLFQLAGRAINLFHHTLGLLKLSHDILQLAI